MLHSADVAGQYVTALPILRAAQQPSASSRAATQVCSPRQDHRARTGADIGRIPAPMWRVPAPMWRVPAPMWRIPARKVVVAAAAKRTARLQTRIVQSELAVYM